MSRTAVLNVVGLTPGLIGPHTPHLRAFREAAGLGVIRPVLPAVTCPAQATYLTGRPPAEHGIVANGWYDRDLAEVHFWKQSNHLVRGEKLWETLRRRRPGFTCAKLFWWYNMHSSADLSVTPRPMYPADGRKVFDIHAWPYALRTDLKRELGEFPFPGFWGPAAGRSSPAGGPDCATRWIAEAAKRVEAKHAPSLSLVYLPHLDYNLQRFGVWRAAGGGRGLRPEILADLRAVDELVGDLVRFFEGRGVQVAILSEYGITDVGRAVHLNRLLRGRGWLTVKEELGLELLDPGNSRVFAVADHQVAHLYLNDPSLASAVRDLVGGAEGVAAVLGPAELAAQGLVHRRAGDLVAVAREDAWFTYCYWLDDARAPDFARCVDIHRKPGYDPVELFTDPALSPLALKAKIGWRLLQKRLGFRMLMDVIPLDAALVKGSHGACPANRDDWPLLLARNRAAVPAQLAATDVRDVLLRLADG
jgi:predicted AlkP superfamily pyrophosphatase or phosphodiesterase